MNSELIEKLKNLPKGCDVYAGDLDNPPVVDTSFSSDDLIALAADYEALQNATAELWCGLQEAIELICIGITPHFQSWKEQQGDERLEACQLILDVHRKTEDANE